MSAAAHARYQDPARDPQLKRLLIRPGAIGDCIVSLPALQHLRADYTEVWVSSANVPLIRFTDRVRSIASTGIDLVEFGTGEHTLRELERFDSVVSWYGASRAEFREAVAHLPFVFHPALPTAGGRVHAVDYYSRQAGAPEGLRPVIQAGREDQGFAVIHPFSSSPKKNWPLEKFQHLASSLGIPGSFCAGPEEELAGAVRIEDLYELACWIAKARLFIGNDSGITHLAAAVGVPVVAIFRATDPQVWSPRGERVRLICGDPAVPEVRALAEAYLA